MRTLVVSTAAACCYLLTNSDGAMRHERGAVATQNVPRTTATHYQLIYVQPAPAAVYYPTPSPVLSQPQSQLQQPAGIVAYTPPRVYVRAN